LAGGGNSKREIFGYKGGKAMKITTDLTALLPG